MSKIVFYFQPSFSGWMPTTIYETLYKYYKSIYHQIICDNISISYNNNYGHRSGPHHLIIENTDTKYYKVITYWDRAYELFKDEYGWNNNKCLGIYSSVDSAKYPSIHKISYCVYNTIIHNTINSIDINFDNKNQTSLLFRGFLYSDRYSLGSVQSSNNSFIKILPTRISYDNYIKELNSYKIGLSFNGAAEICNRDIEILGVGSVLLRPKLINTGFLNPLIPDFHYITFEISSDPKQQIEIIKEKYNFILKDTEYMRYIALNGRNWYNKNGSLEGNVSVLLNTINIQELFNE